LSGADHDVLGVDVAVDDVRAVAADEDAAAVLAGRALDGVVALAAVMIAGPARC